MDAIIKRISEQLVAPSSRRGFFSKMGKAVLGAAGLFIGLSPFDEAAQASLKCCNHTTPCQHYGCPSGTSNTYIWRCSSAISCHDCYSDTTHTYVCTYTAS
jgi:hypothetical protein